VGWLIVISAIISTATVVNGYVGYVQVFVDLSDWIIITGIIIILTAVAVWGITESAFTITTITIIELIGLLLVIVIAADNLSSFPERWPELIPSFTIGDWQKVLLGAFLAFFTFIGFQDMVNVAEEAKNPERDMPKAIIISLIILTVLYIIVAVIAGLGLTPEELDQSDAPLADILAEKGKWYPKIISGIGTIAIINGVLVQFVMIARVLYGMAQKSMAPKLFGKLNKNTRTPVWGTVITSGVILILALSFDLEALAEATNYILLIVFMMVNLALWRIKTRDPDPEDIKTYGIWIPIVGFILSFGILLFQIYSTIWS
jgi:amino acid transporter